jgi:transglutaminase superfamily protein
MSATRLSPLGKLRLTVRIWARFAAVRAGVNREPLPAYVERLGDVPGTAQPIDGRLLARAVDRCLRVGSARPRCLYNALVLYRLLREQGEPAELVVGLLPQSPNEEAHAWVELGGYDMGPAPGRNGHEPMARFGA